MAPPHEQSLNTYPRTVMAQYLRILLSSFGEEDFQMFGLNLLCSNCL